MFKEFAFTMMTLPASMLYNKSNKAQEIQSPKQDMIQRRMFLKGNCNDFWPRALLICVTNVSEQREFTLLDTHSKEGSRVSEGDTSGSQTLGLNEFTAESFGARFSNSHGDLGLFNPVSLCSNPEYRD